MALLLLAATPRPVLGQYCLDYRQFFAWTDTYYRPATLASDLLIVGTLGYAALGSGLTILDLTDPENPIPLCESCVPSAGTTELAYRAPYVFSIGAIRGFQIIDVRDPSAPFIRGASDPWNPSDIALWQNYAFVSNLAQGIYVYDITDADHPFEAAYYRPEEAGLEFGFSGLAIHDGYLLAAYYYPGYSGEISAGLMSLDISEPLDLHEISRLHLEVTRCLEIGMRGDLAAVTGVEAVHLVDVGDPAALSLVASIHGPATPFRRHCTFDGPLLWVSSVFSPTVEVFDCRDPAAPVRLGGLSPLGTVSDLESIGGKIIAACRHSGFLTISLDAFARPEPLAEISLPGVLESPAGAEERIFTASTARLFEVIDVSDPTAPFSLAHGPEGEKSARCSLSGSRLVCAQETGIRVVDVSDPTAPVTGPFLYSGATLFDVEAVGNHAFLACFDLRVVDVSDPLQPELVTSLALPTGARGVTCAGNLLYVRGTSGRLHVVDISEPTQPELLGSYDSSYESQDFATVGARGYFLMDYRLELLDLSDPTAPTFLRHLYDLSATPSKPFSSLTIAGDLLIVTGDQTLSLIDIADPDQPRPLAAGFVGVGGEMLAATSTCLAYTDSTGVLRTLPLPCGLATGVGTPSDLGAGPRVDAWPNPFSPRVAIRFSVPRRGGVDVAVYSVDGRLVKRLYSGHCEPSSQELWWEGDDDLGRPQPAGVYFVRLQGSAGTTAAKVILTR